MRPLVTLTYAQSINGTITHQRGTVTAISGEESLVMTHRLRADHDAILVGINTVLSDDPQLTVRLVKGTNPQPIVLDSHLRFPLTAKLLASNPLIATTVSAESPPAQALTAQGATILQLPADEGGRVSLPALLAQLGRWGVSRLLVEGGGEVITAFLAQQLVDSVVITIAPTFLGGYQVIRAPIPVTRLNNVQMWRMGNDMVIVGDI